MFQRGRYTTNQWSMISSLFHVNSPISMAWEHSWSYNPRRSWWVPWGTHGCNPNQRPREPIDWRYRNQYLTMWRLQIHEVQCHFMVKGLVLSPWRAHKIVTLKHLGCIHCQCQIVRFDPLPYTAAGDVHLHFGRGNICYLHLDPMQPAMLNHQQVFAEW